MEEDERAAKAARARAMLKKRQQKNVGGITAMGEPISRIASPSPPTPRSLTPAPPESHPHPPPPHPLGNVDHAPRDGRDLGDLFTQGESNSEKDREWFSALTPVDVVVPQPHAPTPAALSVGSHPPPGSPHTLPPSTGPRSSSLTITQRGGGLNEEQAGVIATLEAEKASLVASLNQLEQAQADSRHALGLLQEERSRTKNLQHDLQRTQKDAADLSKLYKEQQRAISVLESEKATLANLTSSLESTIDESRRHHAMLEEERGRFKEAQDSAYHVQVQLQQRAQSQQDYIASLESERKLLDASTQKLSSVQSRCSTLEKELQDERSTSAVLRARTQELEETFTEITTRSEQQQQTISLLVSEKSTLASQLEQLRLAESDLLETSKLLEAERSRTERLQNGIDQLETERRHSSQRVEELLAKERDLADITRDQERELKLLTATSGELRTQVEDFRQRVRELEEQIEGDDRAERLEAALLHAEARAAELELQVTKLKQVQATLRAERDDLESQLHAQKVSETAWRSLHAEIEKQNTSTKTALITMTSERDSLLRERSALQSQVDDLRASLVELQQKLSQTAAEMMASIRALQQTQVELRSATRRADEAEQIQKDLRAEGMQLVLSLDEMRQKNVELTDTKLELGEKLTSLEHAVRTRDTTIAQLEGALDEVRDQVANLEKQHQGVKGVLERERLSSHESATDLQKACVELQDQLWAAEANVRRLEEERSELRDVDTRRVEELEQLSNSFHTYSAQVTSLRAELVERNDAKQEAQEFLERARDEMEVLRTELAAKDTEIERLREVLPPSAATGSHSLDEEMLRALKQQHDLELSAAQSEIRHLETVVFQTEARAHSLQRQLNTLEDQLAHFRPVSRSSGVHLRSTSRVGISDELRRASFGTHRPNNVAPPASDFGDLPPETRHKRRVSLSMLKARIDSEAAANKLKGMSPLHKPLHLPSVSETDHSSSRSSPVIVNSARRAPQFLDETHVFWCSSCHGDLVIL